MRRRPALWPQRVGKPPPPSPPPSRSRWRVWRWAAPSLCAICVRSTARSGRARVRRRWSFCSAPARHAGAPACAHRVGRRGEPRDVGRESGAGRGRRGGHACVRRGGCRCGWLDRRGAGRCAGRPRAHAPGDRGHAPCAGGRARASPLRGAQDQGEGDVPETDLRRLAADERPAEIARMLSGDATETSLAHAREMLAAVR